MPINWRLAAPEVRYILEHSGARVLFCDDALLPLADEAARGLERRPVRVSFPPVDAPGWTTPGDLRHRCRAAERGPRVAATTSTA